ncbi:hypothetical protein [Lysobacter gummosus]|uniref:hypothetical protein n=1 Tax=Lysobacter gummosus TaxID=262324 RepID=UPI00363D413B
MASRPRCRPCGAWCGICFPHSKPRPRNWRGRPRTAVRSGKSWAAWSPARFVPSSPW